MRLRCERMIEYTRNFEFEMMDLFRFQMMNYEFQFTGALLKTASLSHARGLLQKMMGAGDGQ